MTYCMGIKLQGATVLISDSRTSAGADDISTYSKMWRYGVVGERQFVMCSAGNLATTQAVITQIERDIKDEAVPSLANVATMAEAAEYVGNISVAVQQKAGGGAMFETSLLFSGEIFGSASMLYLIYPQGNYIASSNQVPFLQIGETKYGKPMLDRTIDKSTPVDRAVLCGLISMEATMKSNLTVGPPIEVSVYTHGSLQTGQYRNIPEDDEYLMNLRGLWNSALTDALGKMPALVL